MTTQHIDCTPTWEGVLPILVEAAANGETSEGRKAAWTELRRMARQADSWLSHCKATKPPQPRDDANE